MKYIVKNSSIGIGISTSSVDKPNLIFFILLRPCPGTRPTSSPAIHGLLPAFLSTNSRLIGAQTREKQAESISLTMVRKSVSSTTVSRCVAQPRLPPFKFYADYSRPFFMRCVGTCLLMFSPCSCAKIFFKPIANKIKI